MYRRKRIYKEGQRDNDGLATCSSFLTPEYTLLLDEPGV
jgi:hypothetical protein